MPQPEILWLLHGGERIPLTGRTAQMAALLAEQQAAINDSRWNRGKVILAFVDGKLVINLDLSLGMRKVA